MDHVPGHFVVQFQDYRGHQFGDKPPKTRRETYPTRALAEARKTELQGNDVIACVTPLYVKSRLNPNLLSDTDLPKIRTGMRLTR